MKRKIVFLTLLFNLACTSSIFSIKSSVFTTTTTAQTATPFTPTQTATPFTPTQTTPPELCAVVVAVKSLNLRDHANGAVIGHLNHDEIVQIIDNQGEWWQVQTDSNNIGFAHSAYLQIVECVNNKNSTP